MKKKKNKKERINSKIDLMVSLNKATRDEYALDRQ